MRIWQRGNTIDCEGGGGPFCLFKVHHLSQPNEIKLESERFAGKFVAINPNKGIKIGMGGKHCVLTFWRQQDAAKPHQPRVVHHHQHHHQPQAKPIGRIVAGKFESPYHFKMNKKVVVGGPHGNHLRVSPQNIEIADGLGQRGEFAQWDVIIHQNNLVLCLRFFFSFLLLF